MKKIIFVFILSILVLSFSNTHSKSPENKSSYFSDSINPNVKVFRNVPVYEFFNSNSFSSIDLYQGLSVVANDAIRDVELADSLGSSRDRFYIRSGDGTIDNFAIGQETKFIPIFETRALNYSQANFDTIKYINPGHAGNLLPADFYKWSLFSLGRNFNTSDVRVYGFWLKGKKIALGLPYEVYGILYLKSIETVNINGIDTYKLTLDIKINIHGQNDFRETIVGIQPISSEIVSDYILFQNYPNPFNPTTKIQFNIPQKGFTRLTVFDSNGKEIEQLINQNLNSGKYEYTWNAVQYSSGVYYYKIESSGFSQTRKMLLIK